MQALWSHVACSSPPLTQVSWALRSPVLAEEEQLMAVLATRWGITNQKPQLELWDEDHIHQCQSSDMLEVATTRVHPPAQKTTSSGASSRMCRELPRGPGRAADLPSSWPPCHACFSALAFSNRNTRQDGSFKDKTNKPSPAGPRHSTAHAPSPGERKKEPAVHVTDVSHVTKCTTGRCSDTTGMSAKQRGACMEAFCPPATNANVSEDRNIV